MKNVDMQRRHFELIAKVINNLNGPLDVDIVAKAFANELWATNENFDRARFLKACGVQP